MTSANGRPSIQQAVQNHLNTPSFQQIQQIQHHQVQTIFDPEVVKKYSELVPTAPERILAILEKNNESERLAREKTTESSIEINRLQAADNKRRDWMAFILLITTIILTAFFAWLEMYIFTGATLLGLFGWIVKGFLNPSNLKADQNKK